MLLEMAIGDAFGAAFEFVKPEEATAIGLINDTETYQAHPKFAIGNGRYTDDTQMSIAVALTILGGPITREVLAENFVSTFKRDVRLGYGSRFYDLLTEIKSGSELLERLKPNSDRSGAAMRVSPFGLYADLKEVIRLSELQASITHDTPEGRMSASAIASMVHYFAHALGPKAGLGAFLEETVPGYAWSEDWSEWSSVQGIPCAHAAITAVRNGTSLREVLRIAIDGGGDVDTVAAMAMFSASLCDEIEQDLPQSLYDGLETGQYGQNYLRWLDKRLDNFLFEQRGLFWSHPVADRPL